MNISKELKSLVRNIVVGYAEYDALSECNILSLDDLPESEFCEISALIMKDNPDYAAEATSPDNPSYEKYMLPALTKHLSKPECRDEKIEFVNRWQKGIVTYFYKTIEKLIEEGLDELNENNGYVSSSWKGESAWV